ncbi:MAG: glycosyltransferase family 2 protein [Gemmatimonadales bacterium]|nr:MAG: glycosyltransferase family 2 protein [Gemmatimonadales bacterium]
MTEKLVCIIPVGPGHRRLSRRAEWSIKVAQGHGLGPFSEVECVLVDDTKGQFGRAAARNHGMSLHPDADWYYFLDADDMMHGEALVRFGAGRKRHPEARAIWGKGLLWMHGEYVAIGDEIFPMTWEDVILCMNLGTFGVGHFVGGEEARRLRFDETVPHCEGFEFCVSFISCFPWVKIEEPLSIIDKDAPSCNDHYSPCPAPWTRAFNAHVMKWKTRGRVPLTDRELLERHFGERERKAWCSSTPATLET